MDKWIDEKLNCFFNKESNDYFNMKIFEEIFDKLENQNLQKTNPLVYNYEVKRIRDLKNVIDTARSDARNKVLKDRIDAEKQKALEMAQKMLDKQMSIAEIVDLTGLSAKEIQAFSIKK